ncbi:MAG: M67 family metallopeptidase [bacterium]|nr:M67 family metallopeptidase [bacterium]
MSEKLIIHLHHRQLEEIHAHGRDSYPEECCGFLFGSEIGYERIVNDVFRIDNGREDNRHRRFLITPEEFQNAERRAQNLDLHLIGIYHSHPDHPAFPSDFDREHALPFYSYVILSVRHAQPAELRSFQLAEDREGYVEEKVIIHKRVAI